MSNNLGLGFSDITDWVPWGAVDTSLLTGVSNNVVFTPTTPLANNGLIAVGASGGGGGGAGGGSAANLVGGTGTGATIGITPSGTTVCDSIEGVLWRPGNGPIRINSTYSAGVSAVAGAHLSNVYYVTLASINVVASTSYFRRIPYTTLIVTTAGAISPINTIDVLYTSNITLAGNALPPLSIIFDGDPFATVPSMAGIVSALQLCANVRYAAVNSVNVNTQLPIPYTIALTGSPVYNFYTDASSIPIATSPTIVLPPVIPAAPKGPTIVYKSGVPYYTTAMPLQISATVTGVAGVYYNMAHVAAFGINGAAPIYYALSAADMATIAAAADPLTVAINASTTIYLPPDTYAPSFTFDAYAINSADGYSAPVTYTGARIIVDTILAPELRTFSGMGTYPAINTLNGPFNPTTSLTTNWDAQYAGGVYMVPHLNYSACYPPGPNYSTSISGGYRWVAIHTTQARSSVSSISISINNCHASSNIPGQDFVSYVTTNNGTWVNALTLWTPGQRIADGMAGAEVVPKIIDGVLRSNVLMPVIAMATDIYVRVGIATSSQFTFGSIVIDAIVA